MRLTVYCKRLKVVLTQLIGLVREARSADVRFARISADLRKLPYTGPRRRWWNDALAVAKRNSRRGESKWTSRC